VPARLPDRLHRPVPSGIRLAARRCHAQYLLAEERTCIPLPYELSFVDGALVSCGFGTAYAGLLRLGVSGGDVS
jgi:D-arabinose 1-dehydrogenase-like Zn-dependent alcohol dehydrogenase